MNIALFLNKDLHANLAYNLLRESLSAHQLRIYYSEGVGDPSRKPADLQRLEHFEKKFSLGELPGILAKNQLETGFEFFVDGFAGAPMQVCHSVTDPLFLQELRQFEPDLFISVRFGKIFKGEILRLPRKGILNLHSAMLPDFKGILGTLHALRTGREELGCTLHYIPDNTIDTGEVIDIARLKVQAGRSLFWHVANLYPLGAAMIARAVEMLKTSDKLPCQIQDTQAGSYFSLPTEQDFAELKARGFEVLNATDCLEILQLWVSSRIDSKMIHVGL
jgi:methionyl-tRNA formyltransferase